MSKIIRPLHIPLNGKTTIADKVFEKLEALQIPLKRIDSKDIRDLIPYIEEKRYAALG